MPTPAIEILGVYRLDVTPELVAQAVEWKYPGVPSTRRGAAEEHVRTELSGAVLVEAVVTDRDEQFRVDDFSQRDSDQAPYAEVFLSADGSEVLAELSDIPRGSTLRVAFFIHFLSPLKPLNTSYGAVALPKFTRMPQRLSSIIRYEPVT